jgi:prepilin-type N-terminal cleavage/methylation domain-containing protein
MSRSCPRDRGEGGFTLIEVTVAMTVLVLILAMSGTLLYSMKSFAQKQQSFAEPRQTARRAMNYLAYYVRGASDMNMADGEAPMPNALVTYYELNGVRKQATYNNVASATLADVGTDLITVAKPLPGSSPMKIQNFITSTSASALYTQGCGNSNDDTTNLSLFKQAVGYDATTQTSPLFLIYNPVGAWQYYQITAVPTCNCANLNSSPSVIGLTLAAGGAGSLNLNPPGETSAVALNCTDGDPCYMTAGMQFITFRVRTVDGTPRLEQLALPGRLFDASQDGPGNSFTPLLDNVEDLQLAYIYGDGTIWNTGTAGRDLATLDSVKYPHDVPYMQQEAVHPNPYDAVNVRGVRISVVARSAAPIPTFLGGATARTAPATPPEDSAAAYAQGYYHYRLTSTIMIQNRVLGN